MAETPQRFRSRWCSLLYEKIVFSRRRKVFNERSSSLVAVHTVRRRMRHSVVWSISAFLAAGYIHSRCRPQPRPTDDIFHRNAEFRLPTYRLYIWHTVLPVNSSGTAVIYNYTGQIVAQSSYCDLVARKLQEYLLLNGHWPVWHMWTCCEAA